MILSPGLLSPQSEHIQAEADSSPAFSVNERFRLIRDGLLNYAGYISASIIGILLVPMFLKHLVPELYGLWIAATAFAGCAGFLFSGLGRAIVREVASSECRGAGQETSFIACAANAYLIFGTLGALFIAVVGIPLSWGLHLSPEGRSLAPWIFSLVGVGFLGDQVFGFAAEVLTGARRFFTLNLIAIAATVFRAAGMVELLHLKSSLISIVALQTFTSLMLAVVGIFLVDRVSRGYLPRISNLRWSDFRPHLNFGFTVQLTSGLNTLLWESPTFLVGLGLGPAAIISLKLGQRFPGALTAMTWHAAEVAYPAASEYYGAEQSRCTQDLLLLGTRGILLLTLPVCIALWILAPQLLTVWLGGKYPGALVVLRLMSVAVLADAASATAVQILYGRGQAKTVLKVTAGSAFASIAVSLLLMPRLGVAAAAWGLCLTVPMAAAVYIAIASRSCGLDVGVMARSLSRETLLPGIA